MMPPAPIPLRCGHRGLREAQARVPRPAARRARVVRGVPHRTAQSRRPHRSPGAPCRSGPAWTSSVRGPQYGRRVLAVLLLDGAGRPVRDRSCRAVAAGFARRPTLASPTSTCWASHGELVGLVLQVSQFLLALAAEAHEALPCRWGCGSPHLARPSPDREGVAQNSERMAMHASFTPRSRPCTRTTATSSSTSSETTHRARCRTSSASPTAPAPWTDPATGQAR